MPWPTKSCTRSRSEVPSWIKAIPDSPVRVSSGLHCLQHLCGYLKENQSVPATGKAELCSWMKYRVTHQYIPFPARGAAVALHLQICGWLLSPAEGNSSSYRTQGFNTFFCPEMSWGFCSMGAAGTVQHQGMGPAPCRQLPKPMAWKESAASGEHGCSPADDSFTSTKEKHGWDTRNESSPHPYVPVLSVCPTHWCLLIPGEGLGSPGKHQVLLDWPKPTLSFGICQCPMGPVTSEMGLRRSSRPRTPMEEGEKGMKQGCQVHFPWKTLWTAERHPGNGILLAHLSAKRYLDN